MVHVFRSIGLLKQDNTSLDYYEHACDADEHSWRRSAVIFALRLETRSGESSTSVYVMCDTVFHSQWAIPTTSTWQRHAPRLPSQN